MGEFRNGNYEGHGYDLWMTPPEIFEDMESWFPGWNKENMFDPCPAYWDGEVDGLAIDWPTDKLVFVNPPYGNIAEWVKKCREQADRGCSVVLLIPARTDTRYLHDYIYMSAELMFLKGRIKFIHADEPDKRWGSAPFPSVICYWRGELGEAEE